MKRRAAAFFSLILVMTNPAFAITAGDVLDRMTSKEQNGYFDGAMEMAIYQAGIQGNKKKSECILNWYYGKESDGKAQRLIIATFDRYKDQQAAALLNLLIERECGK